MAYKYKSTKKELSAVVPNPLTAVSAVIPVFIQTNAGSSV